MLHIRDLDSAKQLCVRPSCVIHFSVQVALKLPLSETTSQSYRPAIIQAGACQNDAILSTPVLSEFTFFKYPSWNYMPVNAQVYWGNGKDLKCFVWERKTWLICQIKFLSNLNLSMPIDTRGIGHNLLIQDVMLKKTKNKEVLKAGFIAYLRMFGFSPQQNVWQKSINENEILWIAQYRIAYAWHSKASR